MAVDLQLMLHTNTNEAPMKGRNRQGTQQSQSCNSNTCKFVADVEVELAGSD
jgi:hypothetical protein